MQNSSSNNVRNGMNTKYQKRFLFRRLHLYWNWSDNFLLRQYSNNRVMLVDYKFNIRKHCYTKCVQYKSYKWLLGKVLVRNNDAMYMPMPYR